MELLLFTGVYWLSCYFNRTGNEVLSAVLLMATGFFLYLYYACKYRDILAPLAVFSVSWIFCIGLSCLQLSELQSVWEPKTWLAFYLIYFVFAAVYRFMERKNSFQLFSCRFFSVKSLLRSPDELQLRSAILILTLLSVTCFLIEALILGFIPLLTVDTPHAYSTFHISGVHYFTVLFVLVPALGVLYTNRFRSKRGRLQVLGCVIVSLLLPFLLVSRFQLLFSVFLAAIVFMITHRSMLQKYLRPKYILYAIIAVAVLLLCYIFITVERAHSVEYLNGIFEMKNPSLPIFITQPYIYIANNFENFNCMVRDLSKHSYGLKMSFPVFALTGLKFIFPDLLSFPLYTTKEELTTVTMFYDAYYDFGMTGCILFPAFLGAVYQFLYSQIRKSCCEILILIYSQLLLYLGLAFFTTWFSNPTVWFYLGFCILAEIIICLHSTRTKTDKKSSSEV